VEANRWENLDLLSRGDELKFVLADEADYRWARQVVTTSSESVATRRSDRKSDWRARRKTWAIIGAPAISRRTFLGSRVESSRAGMTPRILKSAISGKVPGGDRAWPSAAGSSGQGPRSGG